MNWKTLSILSSVALAVASPSVANAQRGGHAANGSGGARMGGMASRPASGGRFSGRTAATNRTATNVNRNSGNLNRHGDRNWNHDHNDRWHHRTNNYYYYGGFGYPYYGGFGYGGFGYPYYGGVSATFYSNGYGYGSSGYRSQQQGYQSGNGSVNARVQQRLASDGYYHGAIDGVIGNGTRSAIRAYERANGLPVDGRIDSQLLSRLGVS